MSFLPVFALNVTHTQKRRAVAQVCIMYSTLQGKIWLYKAFGLEVVGNLICCPRKNTFLF